MKYLNSTKNVIRFINNSKNKLKTLVVGFIASKTHSLNIILSTKEVQDFVSVTCLLKRWDLGKPKLLKWSH